MAIIIKSDKLNRKYELIKKRDREKTLNSEEEQELLNIEKELVEETREIVDKALSGETKMNATIENVVKTVKKTLGGKNNMKPAERKEAALKIVAEGRVAKLKDSDIIKKISEALGTSNTYGYKLVKKQA